MVGVGADYFEVVMFAANANTFLGVGGAGIGAFFEAEKDVLELVHASVSEEQGGVVSGDDRIAGDKGMALLDEKIDKALSNFFGSQHDWDYLSGWV